MLSEDEKTVNVACCHKFRLIVLPKVILISVILLGLCVWAVFRYGNPQWNRWIYVYQARALMATGAPRMMASIGEDSFVVISPPPGYSGKWTMYYLDGSKAVEENYLHGRKHGRQTNWDASRRKRFEWDYRNGSACAYREWFTNGKKRYENNFSNGILVGRQITWHENGCKKSEETRNGLGYRHGKWSQWNQDGELVSQRWFFNGKRILKSEYIKAKHDNRPMVDIGQNETYRASCKKCGTLHVWSLKRCGNRIHCSKCGADIISMVPVTSKTSSIKKTNEAAKKMEPNILENE